jgi:hypothetical protein
VLGGGPQANRERIHGTVTARSSPWRNGTDGTVDALALVEAHRRLWRVTVYVDPTTSAQQRRRVRDAAEETFSAPSRYGK